MSDHLGCLVLLLSVPLAFVLDPVLRRDPNGSWDMNHIDTTSIAVVSILLAAVLVHTGAWLFQAVRTTE